MAKQIKNSSVAAPETGRKPQEDAPVSVITDASDPSGTNGPEGTDTQRESGDAAGEAPAEPVKPHDEDGTPAPVIVTDADNSQSTPEAEASASGDSDHVASQGGAPVVTGAAAGDDGALSKAGAKFFISQVLGVPAPVERRHFFAFGAVRYNNVRVPPGGDLYLTETEHGRLRAKNLVAHWESGHE